MLEKLMFAFAMSWCGFVILAFFLNLILGG